MLCIGKAFSAENVNNYKYISVYNKEYSIKTEEINKKLLKTDMYVMLGGSVLGAGILYLLPESVTHWDKDDSSSIFKKWGRNVRKGPVQDDDDWFLNWVTHPYWGSVYYVAGRSAGLGILPSFGLSVFMSTFFWEYGVEAFAEIPSKQDLIITPVVGSLFGEALYVAKRRIIKNDHKVFNSSVLGHITTFLIDPITEVSEFFIKDRKDNNVNVMAFPTINSNGNFGYNVAVNIRF
ncbi:MAG: DUF3943 domain-containing protein [Rickettsiales bacterium]|nr:DUF3943 domain-containing protein [Rickettsiales bacterium]